VAQARSGAATRKAHDARRSAAAADANLHYVIADLLQGVSLMRGKDPAHTRHDGAALVHGALIAYGTYFEDPAWQPDAPVNEK
jgi:hypothetical protein